MLHAVMQPGSFLFLAGGWVLVLLPSGQYPLGRGCSPWNLGYFLLVQKVTKDTPRERGITIYLRAKSLASLGCAPKRACGRSPFPLDSFPLEPPKTGPAGPFFDLPRGYSGEKFPQKTIEKITPRLDRMRPKGPQSTVLDTKNRSAQNGHIVPPAERQRRKRGKACERCSNF